MVQRGFASLVTRTATKVLPSDWGPANTSQPALALQDWSDGRIHNPPSHHIATPHSRDNAHSTRNRVSRSLGSCLVPSPASARSLGIARRQGKPHGPNHK